MIALVLAARAPGQVLEEARELARHPLAAHFLLELRLDFLDPLEPELVGKLPLPVVATCRRVADRGRFLGSEEERRRILLAAARAGARYVDLEWDQPPPANLPAGTGYLCSLHAFENWPEDLEGLLAEGFRRGAEVVKVAVKVSNLGQLENLRRAARSAPGPVVAIGLGAAGGPTRQLYQAMGSPWTYASPSDDFRDPPWAPGLPTLDELLWPGFPKPPAAVFGVLSDRAQESIGPPVYRRFFRATGQSAVYLPLTAPDLSGLPGFLEGFGFDGLSVTAPFKTAVLGHVGEHSVEVQKLGAANTLVRAGWRWRACNTDLVGVAEPLSHLDPPLARGARAWVLGAGGAARAAVAALVRLGLAVRVVGRTRARAEALARELGAVAGPPDGAPPELIVNATPAGGPRAPEELPLDVCFLGAGQTVFEMNYRRGDTPLLAAARRKGARVIRGRAMFAAQGRAQLQLFPKVAAPARETLEALVGEVLG